MKDLAKFWPVEALSQAVEAFPQDFDSHKTATQDALFFFSRLKLLEDLHNKALEQNLIRPLREHVYTMRTENDEDMTMVYHCFRGTS